MADDEDRPIGTTEAAEILGRSPRSVQRAANTGAIPILRRNSAGLLFSQKQIEELKQQEVQTALQLAKKGKTPAP